MPWLLTVVLIVGTLTSVYAQPVVKLRNLEEAPGANYRIQSNDSGKAIWIMNVSDEINVVLTPIGYVPASFGNTLNLNNVVVDPNGDIWIIDSAGDAVQIGSTNVFSGSWNDLDDIPAGFADGTDNVQDSDSDPTNEIQLSNQVELSSALAINGDVYTNVQSALQAIVNAGVGTGGGFSGSWNDLTNVPAGFADDTDDVDDADADPTNEIQQVDTFTLNGTTLGLSLSNDGTAQSEVDLSALQDGTGTDDQTAAEVSVSPIANLTATDVQAALAEHQSDIDAFVGGGTDDQTAAEVPITDAGGYFVATDVEAALQEEAVNRIALDQLVGDLITLSGVPITSQNLGTFTGTTITDDNTVKGALQELETAVEAGGGGGSGLDYVIQSTEPADTTKLWIDNSPGDSKIWDINQRVGGAWEKIKYYDPISGYVSALPPVYILGTGQSNMLYRPTGGDLTVDQRVVEWRNGAWEICDRTAGNANNLALQFAKNLAEDEDRIVRFAVIAEGSRPIEDWYPDSTKFNEIVEFIDSAKVDQLDLILWRQGERNSDLGDTESEYAAKFDSIFNVFRDSTWFGQKGEIVTATLNEAYSGQIQRFFLNLATSNSTDSRISVASSFGLAPGTGGNHIDGASIDTAGYRMYQAWKGKQLSMWERDGTTITSYKAGDNLNIGGTLGVGVTSPARKVEIYQPATATPELRLTHTVGTHYADFDVNSIGELRFTSSSGAYYLSSIPIGPLPSSTGSVTLGGGSLSVTGTANTLFGTQSGNALTSGIRNTMLGNGAGLLSNGSSNVYIGYRNFQSNVGSFGITSLGVEAAKFHTTGNSLLVGGFNAAQTLTGGGNATSFSNGVYLGVNVKVGTNGATNEIVIGHAAEGDGSNTARLGNSSITKFSSGNYTFNVNQSTTGLDGYVMTYNESNDELELQASALSTTTGIGAISGDSGDGQTLVVTPGINPTAKPIQVTVQITGGTLDVGEQLATITSVTSTTFTVSLQDALESGESVNIHWAIF